MSLFVLVPGAGGSAWSWHRVVPELRARGHQAVAVNLPGPDETAGLPQYRDLIVRAMVDQRDVSEQGDASDQGNRSERRDVAGPREVAEWRDRGDRPDVVVVALSMGAFSAVMACAEVPVRQLVLLNAMIPRPGETPGQWWGNTGSEPARLAAAQAGGYRTDIDVATYFLHDIPAEVLASGEGQNWPEADIAFGQPCDIERWPDVPTRVLAGRDDRFFPLGFQTNLARDRLGLAAEVIPGGHLAPVSYPAELAACLTKALSPAS